MYWKMHHFQRQAEKILLDWKRKHQGPHANISVSIFRVLDPCDLKVILPAWAVFPILQP